MQIGIYAVGKQNFLDAVRTAIPKDKEINFVCSPIIDSALEKLCLQMSTLAIFQIDRGKALAEQVSNTLAKLNRFSNNTATYIFSELPSLQEGIKLIKKGADDYFHYPKDLVKLSDLLFSKIVEWELAQNKSSGFEQQRWGILGNSSQILNIIQQIKRLSSYTNLNVLITGATGTGKELVARAIHYTSHGRSSPFVEVNVSAIPDTLIESELFGHEKGAFTGAHTTKRGLFEAAKGGTIFLDEIGELGLHLQSKLLRVIEHKTIHRLGSTENIPVSTRIIAATNKDLPEAVLKGEFRQDLYFRLNVACIHLPPLQERGHDAILLAKHFLQDFCQRFNLSISGFNPGAKQLILEYQWPGNVRELRHAIERAAISAENKQITKSILQESLTVTRKLENIENYSDNGIGLKLPPHGATLKEIDNYAIRVTLKLVKGNKRKAAKMLGISPPRLYRKIEQMNHKTVSVDNIAGNIT